jgi:hypothetical protein
LRGGVERSAAQKQKCKRDTVAGGHGFRPIQVVALGRGR